MYYILNRDNNLYYIISNIVKDISNINFNIFIKLIEDNKVDEAFNWIGK